MMVACLSSKPLSSTQSQRSTLTRSWQGTRMHGAGQVRVAAHPLHPLGVALRTPADMDCKSSSSSSSTQSLHSISDTVQSGHC
jgi:hypothetical protein